MNPSTLYLEIILPQKEYTLGEPINAKIVLGNRGAEAVLVNNRLTMGYETSFDRELYCRITRDGQPYTGYLNWQVDYNRKRLEDADFQQLEPGQSLENKVDLYEWYHLDGPGNYEFQVFYAPDKDENPALPDVGEVSGRVSFSVK